MKGFLVLFGLILTLGDLTAQSPSATATPATTAEKSAGALSSSPQKSATPQVKHKFKSQARMFEPRRIVPMVSPSASPNQSVSVNSEKTKKSEVNETKQQPSPVSPIPK